MSEPVAKDRPTVDLDDFERRLRQRDHDHEDPLAELARLVGENADPYGDVFAQEALAYPAAGQQPVAQPAPVASEAAPASPRLSGDFAAIEAGLRGPVSMQGDPDPYDSGHEFYAQHERYPQHGQYAPQDQYAADDRYAGDSPDLEGQHWPDAAQQNPPPASAPSRKPIYAMIATIILGVIGVGVAFAYKGSSSSPSEIRTIAAASGPNKIQPPADVPSDRNSQDSASAGQNGEQSAPTRLVNGEEQPVDIAQTVQNASRSPDVGQGDASSVPVPTVPGQADATGNAPSEPKTSSGQTSNFGLSGMPAPKKVKVVSVRPDGTILSHDQPPPAALPDPIAAALSTTPEPQDTPKSSTPKTATPKSTSRVATTPKSTQVAKADDLGDVPSPKPAHKAKPKRVAAVEPTTTSPDTTSGAADAETPKVAGGFAVQLAAPGSEAEAHTASTRLAKKFADALDGRRLGVHKAQSNGKSVFRVRVSSLSKEDAVSLCEKLKANGGSCFVAKN